MSEETKQCPCCDKQMIMVGTGVDLMSYPPKYKREWRCGCWHREAAPAERRRTIDEQFLERWRAANK